MDVYREAFYPEDGEVLPREHMPKEVVDETSVFWEESTCVWRHKIVNYHLCIALTHVEA